MQGSRPVLLGLLMTVVAPAAFSFQGVQAQTLTEDHLSAFDYRSIGPTRQSGRFIDIAVPAGQSKTFYIATGSGHLWKTENHGQSFDVLFDEEGVFSIGAVAVSASFFIAITVLPVAATFMLKVEDRDPCERWWDRITALVMRLTRTPALCGTWIVGILGQ